MLPEKPEDGKIEWHHDAQYLIRLINASGDPYAGAFLFPEWSEIYHLASVHLSTGIFLSSDKWAGPRNNVGWCRSGSKKWSYKDNRSSIKKIRGCPSKMIKSIRERLTGKNS